MSRDFSGLPAPPANVTAASVIVRLVDALGFRFHWATEGLHAEDLDFDPPGGGMSIRGLMEHLRAVLGFTLASLSSEETGEAPEDGDALRSAILVMLGDIRERLTAMSDDEIAQIQIKRRGNDLPVWNMIHGPLADALTHVGQINTLRRMSGNPARKVNYLVGEVR